MLLIAFTETLFMSMHDMMHKIPEIVFRTNLLSAGAAGTVIRVFVGLRKQPFYIS